MTIIHERSRILPAPDYTGKFNWAVQQPLLRNTVAEYIADARELTPQFAGMVAAFASRFDFPIELKIAEPKTEESANRKLWDRKATHTNRPEMLKDYGRGTIVVSDVAASQKHHGVDNLVRVINELVSSSHTVAYKDQYLQPNDETGFRSFKAIWEVSGHNFELIVDYAGMQQANRITKNLREIERLLKEVEFEIPQRCISKADIEASLKTSKMTVQVEEGIQAMRDARLGITEMYASRCGLNRLLDPSLHDFHGENIANDFIVAAQASKSIYSKPAHSIIAKAQENLFSGQPLYAYN